MLLWSLRYRVWSKSYGVFPVNCWPCRSLLVLSCLVGSSVSAGGDGGLWGMEKQQCSTAPSSLVVLNDYTFQLECPLFIFLRAPFLDQIQQKEIYKPLMKPSHLYPSNLSGFHFICVFLKYSCICLFGVQ